MVTITKGSDTKPGIFINSLFHAREWITGTTVTYFINELTANANQKINADLISKYRFYIVPVVNPDGYAYSWTAGSHRARLWRKNRSPNGGDKCLGVDLERNFNSHWSGVGSSSNKCSDVYRGPKACSELECEALVKALLDHPDITDYYSFHSYGQIWMSPWSYDYKYAFNDKETKSIMRKAAQEIKKVNGIDYTTGASTDVYDPIAGTIEDWAMETAKINYSYCIELRDKGGYGFELPTHFILPTAKEFWPGLVSSVQHIMDSNPEKTSQSEKGKDQRSSGIGRGRDLLSPENIVLSALMLMHKYLACRHFIP
jgi:carboxypeptidase A2